MSVIVFRWKTIWKYRNLPILIHLNYLKKNINARASKQFVSITILWTFGNPQTCEKKHICILYISDSVTFRGRKPHHIECN